MSTEESPTQQEVSNARGCYSCDVASSKLRRSRTTFNKSLVNFTLMQHLTSSYEKHKEDRREKIEAHSFLIH